MTGLLETLPFSSCPLWFPGLLSISGRDDVGRERNENKGQLTEGTKGTSSVPHPHPCPSRHQWQGLGQPEWKKGEALLFYSNHLPGPPKTRVHVLCTPLWRSRSPLPGLPTWSRRYVLTPKAPWASHWIPCTAWPGAGELLPSSAPVSQADNCLQASALSPSSLPQEGPEWTAWQPARCRPELPSPTPDSLVPSPPVSCPRPGSPRRRSLECYRDPGPCCKARSSPLRKLSAHLARHWFLPHPLHPDRSR